MPAQSIRILLFMAAGLLALRDADAQPAAFPDWAAGADRAAAPHEQPAWRAVPPALRPRDMDFTRRLTLATRALRGSCASGRVAVWTRAERTGRLEREGALVTSFAQVRNLADAPSPGGRRLVIVTGRRSSGASGLEIWSLAAEEGLPQRPRLTLLSAPDELWLAAGLVAGRLYVLDGIGPRLLRFRAPAWLPDTPCAFDGPFQVALRQPRRGGWQAIVGVRGAVVGLAARAGTEPRDVILIEGGVPRARWRAAQADRSLLAGAPGQGQRQYMLVAGRRSASVLQTAPRATGPWTTHTAWTASGGAEAARLELDTEPLEGSWLRISTWRSGGPGPGIRVGPARPVIFTLELNEGQARRRSADTLVISGDLLGPGPRVEFTPDARTPAQLSAGFHLELQVLRARRGRLVVRAPPRGVRGVLRVHTADGTASAVLDRGAPAVRGTLF